MIEARPTPGSTTTFGVGTDSQCGHTQGSTAQQVEFYNALATYSRGQPIARACSAWTAKKCSRTVTFMNVSYTANKGYPPCTGPTTTVTNSNPNDPNLTYTENTPQQQARDIPEDFPEDTTFIPTSTPTPRARIPSTGRFTVRIWGNFCYGRRGNIFCYSLKTVPEGILASDVAGFTGYAATFSPGYNCGPERWPTPKWRAAGVPAYAEWCDVEVYMRN